MPFWPVWLQSRGMGSTEIGILTALPILTKLIFSPLFASLGDKHGERKRLLMGFVAAALICFSLFYAANSFFALLLVSLLYGICWAPVMSFGDNITMLSTRDKDIQYGRLRLWGSLSFIFMSFSFGYVLENRGTELIYWTIIGATLLTLLATTGLPDVRIPPLGKSSRPVRTLLKNRSFKLFMGCVAMIHGSHAVYYAFATLHWRSLGYSDGFIGFLWAEAVAAEVVFFIYGGRIGNRFSPAFLLVLSAAACVLRWFILAFDPTQNLLMLTQLLHAFTFGAMHLGAMLYMSRAVSLDLSATAQSLYGAAAFGIGTGTTLLFVGFLYEAIAAYSFLLMTLMGFFGTLLGLALKRHEKREVPENGTCTLSG